MATYTQTTRIDGYLKEDEKDPHDIPVITGDVVQGDFEKFMMVNIGHLLPDEAQADADTGEGREGTFVIGVSFTPKHDTAPPTYEKRTVVEGARFRQRDYDANAEIEWKKPVPGRDHKMTCGEELEDLLPPEATEDFDDDDLGPEGTFEIIVRFTPAAAKAET